MTLDDYAMILRSYGICDSDVKLLVNIKARFLNDCFAIEERPQHSNSYIKQIEAIDAHYKKEESRIFSKYGIRDWRKGK